MSESVGREGGREKGGAESPGLPHDADIWSSGPAAVRMGVQASLSPITRLFLQPLPDPELPPGSARSVAETAWGGVRVMWGRREGGVWAM